MYRFDIRSLRLKRTYLYAVALTLMLVGMALWSFAPPRPSALVSGEINLEPDTNVQFVGKRGLFVTPFSDWNSQLGQEVTSWVKTLPISSVDEAASWVLSHTHNDGATLDTTNAFQALKMIKDGRSVVNVLCDEITDMFLIIVQVKGLAGAGFQAGVRVKDPSGKWDNAQHAVGVVISKDGSQAYIFYTWPYGIYSVWGYDGLSFGNGQDYPAASNSASQLQAYWQAHPDKFPTSDGWYSVATLLATSVINPQNATKDTTTGCPLWGSYNKGTAPENCTTCPKSNNLVGTSDTEGSGVLYAWIQDGKILFKATLQADWPNNDQVGIGLSPQKFYITCVETGRTVKVEYSWSLYYYWGYYYSKYMGFDYFAMESDGSWYQFLSDRYSGDLYTYGIITFSDTEGHYMCYTSPCQIGGGSAWYKYPKTVVMRNYDWSGNSYKPRTQPWGSALFDLSKMRNYLLTPNAPKVVHLAFTLVFPPDPQKACMSADINGNCIWYQIIQPKPITIPLVWDTTQNSGSGEASGNLTLLLNQNEYAPNETATAWLKAGEEITSVQASYDSTQVNFTKDSADGKVWKSAFKVPSKEGSYTLTAKTNLGTVNATFRVTSTPSQEPIIVKFDRDPPVYKVGEKVSFSIIVNLNGSYDISAYIAEPKGSFRSVPLSKISDKLFEGSYDNTAWEGTYKLSVVVNGTGCFFRDKQMNNVKKEVTFTVKGIPPAIKVWFNKDAYQPNEKVVMWVSTNPQASSVTATLDTGVQVNMTMVEGLWRGEFYASSIPGKHNVLVTADGFSVQATYTVGGQAGSTKLFVTTDRDKYPPGSKVKIIGYIQNGQWGKYVSNPKVTVTLPNGKSVEIGEDNIKYFVDDPIREDLIYAYFSDTSQPGTYTVQMEVTYGYASGVGIGDKLIGSTTFTVLGNQTSPTGGLGGVTEPNSGVYDFLVSHGVPPELAKILAMPITWILLGILVIALASRRGSYSYSGRYRV